MHNYAYYLDNSVFPLIHEFLIMNTSLEPKSFSRFSQTNGRSCVLFAEIGFNKLNSKNHRLCDTKYQ